MLIFRENAEEILVPKSTRYAMIDEVCNQDMVAHTICRKLERGYEQGAALGTGGNKTGTIGTGISYETGTSAYVSGGA